VRATLALALVLIASACGGGEREVAAPSQVRFKASDGVQLAGTLFGSGDVAVVCSHMGRSGDTQAEWFGLAKALAARGYLVLTYNRRGIGPSKGFDSYSESWRDVVGADRFVRSRGARRVILIGASIGAMSSLYAAARGAVAPAGLAEIAGIEGGAYSYRRRDVHRIPGLKLFVSSRDDIYGGAPAARHWYRWASPPKRLVLLPGDEHGTDMLAPIQPTAKRLREVLIGFVDQAAEG
jgi:pimeloyl-ACP methyl ester carboxylesterase